MNGRHGPQYPPGDMVLQDTNHPGIKTDGVWLYDWSDGKWTLASTRTVELYGHLVKNRAKYGPKWGKGK